MQPGDGSPDLRGLTLALRQPGLDDDQLMLGVQRDERGAFQALYERHAARALNAARAVCPGWAEDAVQEGFVSVWRDRGRYHPQGASLGAWIITIVRRRALDLARLEARRGGTRCDSPCESIAASGSLEEEAIARGQDELLRAALRRLPEPQREVILLAFFGGLTHHQIAARLGLPEGTVKGRMRLGLETLRGTSETWTFDRHDRAG